MNNPTVSIDESKITRVEVIDETGRAFVALDVVTVLSVQDDGRTLKVFVSRRGQK